MRPTLVRALIERELAAAGEPTPIMLWGPPGVGKSAIVAAIAGRQRVPLIDVRLAQMEPTDLRGIPFRVENRVEWSVPSLLPDATRDGPRGILFLDEINVAPPAVTAAAYQLILDRRLGDYRVPPGWALVAAGNRQGDRGLTYQMPAPLANRFAHYEIEPDLDDWADWAFDAGIDARIIAFLRFRPELLFQFDAARPAAAFPSPRSWEYAHRALAKFADDGELLREALQGAVGPVAAAGLTVFIRHAAALPDPEAILAGNETRVPDEVDLLYAICSELVVRAKAARSDTERRTSCTNILRYARRFARHEIAVMLVRDLQHAIGSPLIELPEFSLWANSLDDAVMPQAAAPRG